MRAVSPFLHTVCCLLGIRWSNSGDGTSSALHREIYEITRQMLGDVMLITPLPIDEINGILVMAQFASSPTVCMSLSRIATKMLMIFSHQRGSEYIDSWLLSGHCAQQAMLSFNFSEISSRISDGTVTASDHRAIRIWANICLVNLQLVHLTYSFFKVINYPLHLRWGATAGRPPTIPSHYLNQCKLLLNLEQATLRDGMLVAEIELYTIVHDQFASKHYLDRDGGSQVMVAWKSKWNHLLGRSHISDRK